MTTNTRYPEPTNSRYPARDITVLLSQISEQANVLRALSEAGGELEAAFDLMIDLAQMHEAAQILEWQVSKIGEEARRRGHYTT